MRISLGVNSLSPFIVYLSFSSRSVSRSFFSVLSTLVHVYTECRRLCGGKQRVAGTNVVGLFDSVECSHLYLYIIQW